MIRSSAKNSQTDEQLVAEFKRTGNKECVEILFNRYCQLVFGVAMKYLHDVEESKDAVIAIFEKVPADLSKYDIKNFSHWVYIVAKNHCYHLLKKRKNHLPIEKADYMTPGNMGVEEPGDAELEEELMNRLPESLDSLNDSQRRCVTLFYLEEKSYEEIEQLTGFTYKEVKSHIQNGKRNLRIYLLRFKKKLP